jgi:hypothetical protein
LPLKARRIAINIARLPELLGKAERDKPARSLPMGGIATASAAGVPTKPSRMKDVPAGWDSGNVKARHGEFLKMPRWAAVGVDGSMVPRLDDS